MAVLLFGILIWWEWPDPGLQVVMCDVGQGDATLVYQGFDQVLIDTGPGSSVLSCLEDHIPFWDKKIEMVMVTHPQNDHMGALDLIAQHYRVDTLILPNYKGKSELEAELDELLSVIQDQGTRLWGGDQGQIWRLGEMTWRVLWPAELPTEEMVWGKDKIIQDQTVLGRTTSVENEVLIDDVNEVSLVVHLAVGEFDMLLMGDATSRQEQALLSQRLLMPVEILKVGHHGSKTSSGQDFLEATNPDIGIIGVGENNRYGHPHPEVLKRLTDMGTYVYRTDRDGSVWLTINGSTIRRRN